MLPGGAFLDEGLLPEREGRGTGRLKPKVQIRRSFDELRMRRANCRAWGIVPLKALDRRLASWAGKPRKVTPCREFAIALDQHDRLFVGEVAIGRILQGPGIIDSRVRSVGWTGP